MATQTSISNLLRQIDNQKMQAIHGTIHLWSDPSCNTVVNDVSTKLNGITMNKNQFIVHKYSGSQNPTSIINEMAQCIPKIIICCFADCRREDVRGWVTNVYPAYNELIPNATFYWINIIGLIPSDQKYLNDNEIIANPTIVVYKMGHIIDKFVPNIVESQYQGFEEYFSPLPGIGPKRGVADELVKHTPGYDPGREDYEERMRKKEIEAEERKRIESLLEKKRIKEKIEANRRDRMGL